MPVNKPIPDDKRPQGQQPQKPRQDSGGIATLVQAEKLMQIAILLPSSAFVGWLLGSWADKALHQEWISLAGLAFGGIAGLVYVVRLVLSTGGDDTKKPGGLQ
jgi:ATP synthase protein I